MIRAGFLSSAPSWNWSRQFRNFHPEWDGVRFLFSEQIESCDVLFVYDAVPGNSAFKVRAKHRVFIASEPSSVKSYLPSFLNQFDRVLTTDQNTKHLNVVFSQLGLPWLVGAWDSDGKLLDQPLGYSDFEQFSPAKTKHLSIVTSNKAFTEGHRARLAFADRIKAYFGSDVDVFGRGINGFADKLEVLAPYRYHIAIENSTSSNYWTEKLADPFLTLTYPIYHGCPNILEYFPAQSVTQINILNPDDAIQKIKKIIDSDEAERALPHLQEARKLVLNDHNLFAILAKLANELASETIPQDRGRPYRLKPERSFQPRFAKLGNAGKRLSRRLTKSLTRFFEH